MKNSLVFAGISILLFLSACRQGVDPEMLNLDGKWKFKTGDDPSWASPGFDDHAWGTIDPVRPWDDQGYPEYTGYAWYRFRAVIRNDLKTRYGPNDSLKILLGRIDDCDQVFLNGEMIGENGRTVYAKEIPGDGYIRASGLWNTDRRYVLSIRDPRIRWDQENVIAVRCYNQDGPGGMFGENFSVSVTGLADYVQLRLAENPFDVVDDTSVISQLTLENVTRTLAFKGELTTTLTLDRTGVILFSEKESVDLPAGSSFVKQRMMHRPRSAPSTLTICFTDAATRQTITASATLPYLLTPPVQELPSINGAAVFGVRPNSPVLFRIAATGRSPLIYSADSLPKGLTLHPETGIITGFLRERGEYPICVTVSNALGKTNRELKIVCGDLISLTPPMGWNSWNCWGSEVTDKKVRKAADAMVSSGLAGHGWSYINIDDGWSDARDKEGTIQPNYKFPGMPALTGYIHSLGLKAGIYSSPGKTTCAGFPGSFGYEMKDAQTYAAWGFDYLKYDWCSYGRYDRNRPLDALIKPYRDMQHALKRVGRDIHYSLCQYGWGDVWTWGASVNGNSWRTTGDITDTWESMSGIGFGQGKCALFSAPGRWNDPDMLVLGWVGWGENLRNTRLTPDEQYTHITLWCLLASPLLLGCDLERLDPFTLNLLTNDEVIAVNQDPLGRQAVPLVQSKEYEIWVRDLADGGKAIGLFNKTGESLYLPVGMKDIGATGKWSIRDAWTRTDLGHVRGHFEMNVRPHGARLVILHPGK